MNFFGGDDKDVTSLGADGKFHRNKKHKAKMVRHASSFDDEWANKLAAKGAAGGGEGEGGGGEEGVGEGGRAGRGRTATLASHREAHSDAEEEEEGGDGGSDSDGSFFAVENLEPKPPKAGGRRRVFSGRQAELKVVAPSPINKRCAAAVTAVSNKTVSAVGNMQPPVAGSAKRWVQSLASPTNTFEMGGGVQTTMQELIGSPVSSAPATGQGRRGRQWSSFSVEFGETGHWLGGEGGSSEREEEGGIGEGGGGGGWGGGGSWGGGGGGGGGGGRGRGEVGEHA
jgi:hypothetical protein